MKILLLGSTGLIGSHFKNLCLQSTEKIELINLVRTIKSDTNSDIKLDFENHQNLSFKTDSKILVIAFGTTIKKAKTQKEFWRVDYEIPLKVAKEFLANGGEEIILVSSIFAKKNSTNFYLNTKGSLEEALKNLKPKKMIIIRPSMLLGQRREKRFLESLSNEIFSNLNFIFINKLKRLAPVEAGHIANLIYHQIFDLKFKTNTELIILNN